MTDFARLDALGRAAAWCRRSDDDAVREVGASLADWLAGGVDRLDNALGIQLQPGQLRRSTVAALEERNRHIREVAERFGLGAVELARELARYEASSWRRERGLEHCPERLKGRPQEYYWLALKSRPRTVGERQIKNIISEIKGGVSFPANRATVDVTDRSDQ